MSVLKRFRIRGGVHPDDNKALAAAERIVQLDAPEMLYVPMQQHIGKPAAAVVDVGQRVLKGQVIGRAQGPISANIHAPVSGVVEAIEEHVAPHPSGLPVLTVAIRNDGKDEWLRSVPAGNPLFLPSEDIVKRVSDAGIVGMGGATFPASVKLAASGKSTIDTLIINGAECEPFLTCDDRLMRERAEAVIDGILIMQHALKAKRSVVVIEHNKPGAIASMEQAARHIGTVDILPVPTLYPMGSEKQMIQTVTGKEVPAGGLGADLGVMVHNVGTAHAVHQALREGRPLISRVVTVSGSAIGQPRNIDVAIGTPVRELIEFCGGFSEPPERVLMGGPMMGQTLPHLDAPVVKGLNGIIALTAAETAVKPQTPCIRCGKCVAACPIGLLPLEMAARARRDDFRGALDYGLKDCIGCGSCSFACPSSIPLVQYFNYAKGVLTERQRAENKQRETRRLAELKTERVEREKREKEEEAARRKAEREARKKAKAANTSDSKAGASGGEAS